MVEAVLLCENPSCRREHPVIDGIPILLADIRTHVAHNALHFLMRDDLGDEVLGLLGDCAGPESALQVMRQHQSHYAADHWSDSPAVLGVLDAAMDLVGSIEAPVLDLGCATGRATFELAARCSGPVLGIDLNFAMLRIAARILRTGQARYPVRRVGMVYDTAEHRVDLDGARVDFWMADVQALPFADEVAGFATSFNLLDCTAAPWVHLVELERVLRPGGRAALCTPYDWSPSATPVEQWLGGHSQRGPWSGRAEPALRALIDGEVPGGPSRLRTLAERERVPWAVRVHDRSTMHYETHLVAIARE